MQGWRNEPRLVYFKRHDSRPFFEGEVGMKRVLPIWVVRRVSRFGSDVSSKQSSFNSEKVRDREPLLPARETRPYP